MNFKSNLARISASIRVRLGKRFPQMTRAIKIGGHSLRGPLNHQLDVYVRAYRFYDYFLPVMCKLASDAGLSGPIVDIGANIGDTAMLIRHKGVRNRIVAVEASPLFFQMLERNVRAAKGLFGDIQLIKAFVGSASQSLVLEYTNGTAGTRVAEVQTSGESVPTISIAELKLENVSVIKVDTDGYDGVILESNLQYLKQSRPIIWAEAFVDSEMGLAAWRSALAGLVGHYGCFYLFDNAGRPALRGELTSTSVDAIVQLVRSAWIARTLSDRGLGSAGVSYYDIALVPDSQSKLWRDFQEAVDRDVERETGISATSLQPVRHS